MRVKASRFVAFATVALLLVVESPVLSGLRLHEWLGIALAAVVAVHFATNIDRLSVRVRAVRRGSSSVGLVLLDAATLFALMLCVVSGLAISADVLETFGLYSSSGFFFWEPLHAFSAKALLALAAVHVAARFARRLRVGSAGSHEGDNSETAMLYAIGRKRSGR